MNGFSPMMSVTEYIMVMSRVPTQGATFPDAIVETMIFGKPYGSARITAVDSVVPWVPPSATSAWISPRATSSATSLVAPAAMIGADFFAVTVAPERLQRRSAGLGHLRVGKVGRRRRLPHETAVDDQRPVAPRYDAVAHVSDLDALGIEGRQKRYGFCHCRLPVSNEGDGRHFTFELETRLISN